MLLPKSEPPSPSLPTHTVELRFAWPHNSRTPLEVRKSLEVEVLNRLDKIVAKAGGEPAEIGEIVSLPHDERKVLKLKVTARARGLGSKLSEIKSPSDELNLDVKFFDGTSCAIVKAARLGVANLPGGDFVDSPSRLGWKNFFLGNLNRGTHVLSLSFAAALGAGGSVSTLGVVFNMFAGNFTAAAQSVTFSSLSLASSIALFKLSQASKRKMKLYREIDA